MSIGPGGDASEEDRSAQPPGSPRPLRRFSPFERRRRELQPPVWRLALAYVCSLLLHVAIAMDLVWVAASLPGGPSAEPDVAWADLTSSEPGAGGPAAPAPAVGAPAAPAAVPERSPAASSPAATGPRRAPGRPPIGAPAPSVERAAAARADRETGPAARPEPAPKRETAPPKAARAPRRQAAAPPAPPRAAALKADAAPRKMVAAAPKPVPAPPPPPAIPEQPTPGSPEKPVRIPVSGLPPMPEGEEPVGPVRPLPEPPAPGEHAPMVAFPPPLPPAKTLTPAPSLEDLPQMAAAPPAAAAPEPTRREAPPEVPVAREAVPPEQPVSKALASPSPEPQPSREQPGPAPSAPERTAPELGPPEPRGLLAADQRSAPGAEASPGPAAEPSPSPAPPPSPAMPGQPSVAPGLAGADAERALTMAQASPGPPQLERPGDTGGGQTQASSGPSGSREGSAATAAPATAGAPGAPGRPAGPRNAGAAQGQATGPGTAATPGAGGTGSASGRGLAARGLGIEFDGPRNRVTHRQVEPVTGRVVGGRPDGVALYVNESPTEVVVGSDGTFGASVLLQPGPNRLRAVATGPDDARAEGSISIEYVAATPGRIMLTSPADGFTLGPDAPPVIVVEGTVEDKTVTTLSLVVNDRRIPVKVSEGRFRKVVPLFAPVLTLRAETSRAGEPGSRSEPVKVYAGGPRKPSAVLVVEWPEGTQGLDVEATAVVRFTPDRLDGPVQTVRLPGVLRPADAAPFEAFWLRGVPPGAYTVRIRHRGVPPNGDLPATLYIPDRDGLAMRPLPAVHLRPSGTTVLARILLPYGVLWEQDDWFIGTSEGPDTITKFRFPEGISWVERRADLP